MAAVGPLLLQSLSPLSTYISNPDFDEELDEQHQGKFNAQWNSIIFLYEFHRLLRNHSSSIPALGYEGQILDTDHFMPKGTKWTLYIIHTPPIISKCSCLLKSMAFPLKNHLKTGVREESLDTSHGNTRLCPTVASKLKGGTTILVGSTVLCRKIAESFVAVRRTVSV